MELTENEFTEWCLLSTSCFAGRVPRLLCWSALQPGQRELDSQTPRSFSARDLKRDSWQMSTLEFVFPIHPLQRVFLGAFPRL